MNIIYVSSLCSEEKYNKLYSDNSHKIDQQIQKYHRLLVEGFTENKIEVTTISAPPINLENTKKRIIFAESEKYGLINYNYLTILNVPLLRNLFIFISSFFKVFLLCIKKRNSVIVCDVLNISVSAGALLASKITRKKSVGIVTDLPSMLGNNESIVRVNNYINKYFDAYVFLTKQMNKVINKKGKPFVVIEGHVDIKMINIPNNFNDKYKNKICHYAGKLDKVYGVKTLTEAFIRLRITDVELHLYGRGDYENELIELSKLHSNIKYFGIAPNDFVVNEQLKSTLLINPRPISEEFTKYSFPSKNMEYIVSGTPILTTKLPGMPKEYYNYVYLIEDESVDGLSLKINEILTKSKVELHEFGLNAKKWALHKKNNVIQGKKVINMIFLLQN
jgi:hypothetical protein